MENEVEAHEEVDSPEESLEHKMIGDEGKAVPISTNTLQMKKDDSEQNEFEAHQEVDSPDESLEHNMMGDEGAAVPISTNTLQMNKDDCTQNEVEAHQEIDSPEESLEHKMIGDEGEAVPISLNTLQMNKDDCTQNEVEAHQEVNSPEESLEHKMIGDEGEAVPISLNTLQMKKDDSSQTKVEAHQEVDSPEESLEHKMIGDKGKAVPNSLNALQIKKDNSSQNKEMNSQRSVPLEITNNCHVYKFNTTDVTIFGTGHVETSDLISESNLEEPVLYNLKRLGFSKWTPVQKYAIPNIISGRDVFAISPSGSGKTMAFLVPIINDIIKTSSGIKCCQYFVEPAAIILSPTKELSSQIYLEILKLTLGTDLKTVLAVSCEKNSEQLKQLRNGCHILVTTTGRLLNLFKINMLCIDSLRYFVLDEGDLVLYDSIFLNQLTLILYPKTRKKVTFLTLIFATTFNPTRKLPPILTTPLFIAVGDINRPPTEIKQEFYYVGHFTDKVRSIRQIFDNDYPSKTGDLTIVFTNNVRCISMLKDALWPFQSLLAILNAELNNDHRFEAITEFKSGSRPILITTYLAGRGLDFPNVKHVIHFDIPESMYTYIVNIGRTGRNGNKGRVSSFYRRKEKELVKQIINMNNKGGLNAADFFKSLASDTMDNTSVKLTPFLDQNPSRENENNYFRRDASDKTKNPHCLSSIGHFCPPVSFCRFNTIKNLTSCLGNNIKPSDRLRCAPPKNPNSQVTSCLGNNTKSSDRPRVCAPPKNPNSQVLKPRPFHSPLAQVLDDVNLVEEEYQIPGKKPAPYRGPQFISPHVEEQWVMKTECPDILCLPEDMIAQSDRGRAYLMRSSVRGINRTVSVKQYHSKKQIDMKKITYHCPKEAEEL